MKLRYTPEARADLREIKEYVTSVLGNPAAAKRITDNILKQCGHLKAYPYLDGELAAKTGRSTDKRYVVCGNHIAFYRVEPNVVSVIRILDGRTNYLTVLFGGPKTPQ